MPDPVHITPGVLRRSARAVPLANPMPVAPPPGARTETPSEATQRRWARQAAQLEQATMLAHADGQRDGYRQGFRWELWAGIVLGAALATLAWSAYLSLAAPEVAPPSAQRPTVRAL